MTKKARLVPGVAYLYTSGCGDQGSVICSP